MQNDMFLVTPMNQQISLNPGQVYEGSIKVAVPADATSDFSYAVSISPYSVIGEDYTASLSARSNHTMITDWITLNDSEGTLSPNGTARVHFTITAPDDAPAGAQYATIVVSQVKETTETASTNIENTFEIASIIYADITGETIHDGHILENTIPSFATTVPITVSARLDNHGNVHDEATITITVKNNLTGESYLPTDTNDGVYTELILPDTTREVTRDIDGLPFLGFIHVDQTIVYNGETSTIGQDILICPIWFMIVSALFLLGLITLIVRLILRHRRSHIIV